jgi:cyclophilin family peptidyl-prolyl cis-trans isomerase
MKRAAVDQNEQLEIATMLGQVLTQTDNAEAVAWLRSLNKKLNHTAPEAEVGLVRVSPATYLADLGGETHFNDWHASAAVAKALGEVVAMKAKPELVAAAEAQLRKLMNYEDPDLKAKPIHSSQALPDMLRAFAAFKPKNLKEVLFMQLRDSDVIVRATAADMLGDLPPADDITQALIRAWPQATSDSLNDEALSILDTLAKQKTAAANDAMKNALNSPDHLVRRRAAALLKANGAGDFSARIGIVKTRNTAADYRRALARIGRKVRAVVTTSRGSFTIELLPSEAPLTVDNFVQLAQRNYFRGITIHRVVPNFVIQDGDPRGDGSGGPGYQIRCEINEVPYDRAMLGMALSGKDTGGSQWFVTHAPQPHLDGGYTVFGRVIAGMEVVDKIARGDVVRSIRIQ